MAGPDERIVSTGTNLAVCGALLALTLATALLGRVDLGPFGLVWLALLLLGTMDDYMTRAWP
jgi:hypothetical protein